MNERMNGWLKKQRGSELTCMAGRNNLCMAKRESYGLKYCLSLYYITPIPRGMPTWTTILQNVKNNHIYNWRKVNF